MSKRARQFGKLPYELLAAGVISKLKPASAKVLLILAAHTGGRTWACRVGLDRLESTSGLTRQGVLNGIRHLEGLGVVAVERGGGRARCSLYQFCQPPLTVSHPETVNPGKGNCQRERAKLSTGVDPNRMNRFEERGAPSAPAAKQPPPDARIKSFLDFFSKSYAEALGRPYIVNGPKDGGIIRRMLAALDATAICSLFELKRGTGNMLLDSWARDKADIGLLAAKINSWLGKTAGGRAGGTRHFIPAAVDVGDDPGVLDFTTGVLR